MTYFRIASVIVSGLLWASPIQAYTFNLDSNWNNEYAGRTVDFSQFQSLDKQPYKLAASPSLVLVHVWATWCGPCLKELPHFDELTDRMNARGLKVISLSVDKGGSDDVIPFLKKHKTLDHTEILVDPKYHAGAMMSIRILPTTILLKDGVEVARLVGPGDWMGDESNELDEILKNY